MNDPAPAMTASTGTGSASAAASMRRPTLTSNPDARDLRPVPARGPARMVTTMPGQDCPSER